MPTKTPHHPRYDVGQGYVRPAWLMRGQACLRGGGTHEGGEAGQAASATRGRSDWVVCRRRAGASSRPAQRSVNTQAVAAGDGQFVAVAASDADYAGLKADVEAAGGRAWGEKLLAGTLVVKAPKAAKARMAASVHAAGVASDHIESIEPPDGTTQGARNTVSSRSTPPTARLP